MSKELSAKEQEFKRDQDKGEPGELDAMGCIVMGKPQDLWTFKSLLPGGTSPGMPCWRPERESKQGCRGHSPSQSFRAGERVGEQIAAAVGQPLQVDLTGYSVWGTGAGV